jgi:hypothetical protein
MPETGAAAGTKPMGTGTPKAAMEKKIDMLRLTAVVGAEQFHGDMVLSRLGQERYLRRR